jgi:PAS domain S-box-containing protein
MSKDVGAGAGMEMGSAKNRGRLGLLWQFAVGAAVFAVLFIISRNNYLLFHSIAEIFSSLVAFTIFVLAWHTRRYTDNDYLLFLGIAYLFVGTLDLIHMLAYTGMGVFEGYGTDLATQLWMAARYIEAFSLLLAPLFITRRLRARLDITVYTVITALVLLSIFVWDIFPACFVEGSGLTLFKKISEYFIALVLVAAIALLFRKRGEFDPKVFRLVVASIALTIVSELCFTLYQDPYAFFNLLGHYFKIVSFYLIYRAIVDTGLEEPYELLFRKLRERERSERAILDATGDSLILLDLEGKVLAINAVAAHNVGKSADDLIGADLADLLTPALSEQMEAVIDEILSQSVSIRREEEFEGRWYENTYYPILDREGAVVMLAVYSRDISESKQSEDELRRYSHDLEMRVKELNCLFAISRIIESAELSIEEILDEVVDILPPAWQYPELTCARITLKGMEFATADFEESPWKLESDMVVFGGKAGRIEVYYREERPRSHEGPFLAEERDLIDAIAERLGRVTERKTVEEALRQSEEKYRLIVDSAQEGIWTIDSDAVTTFVNERMAEMLGYEEEEMLGRSLFEFMDDEGERIARDNLARRREGISEQHDFEFLRKDGSRIYASLETSPFLDENGEYVGALAMVADITDRRHMEEALRESEEKLRSMVEQSSDGIVLVDSGGRIIEWNSAQENIVGLRQEEVLGEYLWDVQFRLSLPEDRSPESHGQLKEFILDLLEKGYTSWYGETTEREMQSIDGELVMLQSVVFPIRSREGLMMGSINRDVTQRVRMEEALSYEVEVNKALAELSRTLLAQASIEDVSDAVLEKAKNLTESPYGFVGYIEAGTGHLISPTLTSDIWDNCEVAGKSVVFKDFKGLWGWVLHNRQPLLTNAPGEDPRSTGVPEGHVSIERFLAVPAMIGGALVGLIAVANSSRDYTQRDVDVLDRMADLYAMAVLRMWSESELESYREHLEDLVRERTLELERINRKLQEEVSERKRNQEELRTIAEQLRALTAHMESIREEERRRIALEVHDTLGQALTGLKINLSILGKKVAGEEELEESVEAMSVLLDSTIASVREIATELRPGVLDDLGLAAALEWQLARFGEITGLEYHFAADAEESPLEKGLSIALFRIAQEALTNVARHAEATKVELSLSGSDREVILEVRDDGRGITVNEITGFDSLGILGMRERAHALGGKVSVRKGRDGGTIVKVTVPLGTSGKRSIDARKKEGEP